MSFTVCNSNFIVIFFLKVISNSIVDRVYLVINRMEDRVLKCVITNIFAVFYFEFFVWFLRNVDFFF
jgi:hypothetical protein